MGTGCIRWCLKGEGSQSLTGGVWVAGPCPPPTQPRDDLGHVPSLWAMTCSLWSPWRAPPVLDLDLRGAPRLSPRVFSHTLSRRSLHTGIIPDRPSPATTLPGAPDMSLCLPGISNSLGPKGTPDFP